MKSYTLTRPEVGDRVDVIGKPWISNLKVTEINDNEQTAYVLDETMPQPIQVHYPWASLILHQPKSHVAFAPETNFGHLASTNFRKAQGYANTLEPTQPEPCLYEIGDRVKCLRELSSYCGTYGTIVQRMGILWSCHQDAIGDCLLGLGPLTDGLSSAFERLAPVASGALVRYPEKPTKETPVQIVGRVLYRQQDGKYSVRFGYCKRFIFPEFLTAIIKED